MEKKVIHLDGDEAQELAMAATGSPYFIAVNNGKGKVLMRWSDDFNLVDLFRLLEHFADTDKNFKDVLCNWIIDYSKNF